MQNTSNITQPDSDDGPFAACTSVALRAVVRVVAQQAARAAFAAAAFGVDQGEDLASPKGLIAGCPQ